MHKVGRATALFLALAMAALGLAASASNRAEAGEEIVVFAAASLKNALDDVAAAWKRKTGTTVRVSLAGSSKLAKQIQQGAPADLFISANVKWMDVLQDGKLIDAATRRNILRNELVLVAHGKSAKAVEIAKGLDLVGLLDGGRLAMAMLDSVPAGIYGKAALKALGMWEAVGPSIAQTDNVRAALALVARGEAPYGIVYATDAAASDNVTIVGTFPGGTHPPIIYPGAMVADSKNKRAAKNFLDYLTSDEARPMFEKQGFKMIPSALAN